MNFFEAQAQAKRKTFWLVLLFALAVLILIILTNFLIIGFLAYSAGDVKTLTTEQAITLFNWKQFIAIGSGVIALILLGSLYKIRALSAGGQVVAEMLNGQLIPANTQDPKQRQLLNVVEEMAIASGSPVPSVYLLNESAINAFAAGNSPQNAVIGITRGTLDKLNRDELQGVIAHEFSHIFNGDMKLNMQLIGVLNGILLIYLAGYFIFHSTTGFSRRSRYSHRSSQRKGSNTFMIMILGLGLMTIGSVGKFFGQWIKAIISRQREYLADASAVQFTRNSQGIANALKKIGGLQAGSVLHVPSAAQYSHAYFAEGVNNFWQSLFTTHPPLSRRIKRIEPTWNGKYITLKSKQESIQHSMPGDSTQKTKSNKDIMDLVLTGAVIAGSEKMLKQAAEQIVAQAGNIQHKNIAYAQQMIDEIPDKIKTATEEPFSARAVIYIILLENNKKDQASQLSILNQYADLNVAEYTVSLHEEFKILEIKFHLPLLELCIPSLKQLSINQYKSFRETVEHLIIADSKVNLKEWFIQRLVLQKLDEHFGLRKQAKAIHFLLGSVKAEAELLLSLLAIIEHRKEDEAMDAFYAAIKSAGAGALKYSPQSKFSLNKLNHAADKLSQMKPLLKQRYLHICAGIILYDGKVTDRGMELIRTVSSILDCPMPPVSIA